MPDSKAKFFLQSLAELHPQNQVPIQDTCCVPSTVPKPSGMLSSNGPMEPYKASMVLLFREKDAKLQRGYVTYSRSHSYGMIRVGCVWVQSPRSFISCVISHHNSLLYTVLGQASSLHSPTPIKQPLSLLPSPLS